MVQDEKQVIEIMDTIREMMDPFQNDPKQISIVNLSSGVVAPDNIEKDLVTALDKGNGAFKAFVSDNLFVDEPNIFTPIKKMNLKTFASIKKDATRRTSKGQLVSLKADRNTFARLFMVGQNRSIDVQQILSHCLGPYPLSLATVHKDICKSTKSKLLQILETEVPNCLADHVPDGGCILLDAMAVLQSTTVIPNTYGELSDAILSRIVATAKKLKASRVDFVTDRYPALSIKNAEREKRASLQGTSSIRIYGRNQAVFKPWKKFLSSGQNKENLVEFLLDSWSKTERQTLSGLQLYVTCGNSCSKLVAEGDGVTQSYVVELSCDHEEADTRIMLHAAHAARSGYQTVVIKSPDTDVFILALFSKLTLNETSLFLITGTGDHLN